MGDMVKPGTIGSILLNSQIITEAHIAEALKEQALSGCRIGEALVKLGIVAQEDIDWALSNQLNIPYVRLKREMIDPAIVNLVPAQMARQYGLIPLIRVGDELTVAMIDPLNLDAIAAVEKVTGCSVAVSVALIRELQEVQEHFYGALTPTELLGFKSEIFPAVALQKINADLTGAVLIDFLLRYMVQQNITAVSLLPVNDVYRVMARKKGRLREIGNFPGDRATAVLQRLQRLAGTSSNERRAKGTLSSLYKGKELLFQVLFLAGIGGDCVTLRRQFIARFPDALEDFLGTTEDKDCFRQLATVERGIILCASCDRDDRDRLIDLFIDEQEEKNRGTFLIGEGLGQGRLKYPRIPHQGVPASDFSSLLKSVLDHEPDTIAIDDASEAQVMLAAGKAALKGKLVVAGIHFSDLKALFRYLAHLWRRHHFVPASIKGILVCRGLQLLCPHCRQAGTPSEDEMEAMGLQGFSGQFFTASGCQQCDYTGFNGRSYLLEVIPVTTELLHSLDISTDGHEVVQYLAGKTSGGLRAQGENLLREGRISPAEFISGLVL